MAAATSPRAGRLAARALLPFARAYARHVEREITDRELLLALRARAAPAPRWARAGMVAAALAARWLAPLLLAGRPRRFESLPEVAREKLLERLQHARSVAVRGAFFLVKSPVLLALYGHREQAAHDDVER